MATTMHCDIVSAEKEIFSGPVTMVIATGTLGELGILPGHAPLLTGIKPGPVRLQFENGEEDVFFASGGVPRGAAQCGDGACRYGVACGRH